MSGIKNDIYSQRTGSDDLVALCPNRIFSDQPDQYDRWLAPGTEPHELAWCLAPLPSERVELIEMAADGPKERTLFD